MYCGAWDLEWGLVIGRNFSLYSWDVLWIIGSCQPSLFHEILQVYMSFHLMQIQLFALLNIFASISLVATPLLYTQSVPEALNTE